MGNKEISKCTCERPDDYTCDYCDEQESKRILREAKEKLWQPVVNNFNVYEAEKELKNCPLIVKQYVKLLKEDIDRWKEINSKALGKIRELAKQTRQ